MCLRSASGASADSQACFRSSSPRFTGVGLTKPGAYAAVLAAAVSWAYLFYSSNFAKNARYTVDFTIGENTYQTMPVATMVACSVTAMVLVSLATKPPSDQTLSKFFTAKK